MVTTEATTESEEASEAVIGTSESEPPINEIEQQVEVPVEDDELNPVQVEEAVETGANNTSTVNQGVESEATESKEINKIITLLYTIAVEVTVGCLIGVALVLSLLKKNAKESPRVLEQNV